MIFIYRLTLSRQRRLPCSRPPGMMSCSERHHSSRSPSQKEKCPLMEKRLKALSHLKKLFVVWAMSFCSSSPAEDMDSETQHEQLDVHGPSSPTTFRNLLNKGIPRHPEPAQTRRKNKQDESPFRAEKPWEFLAAWASYSSQRLPPQLHSGGN